MSDPISPAEALSEIPGWDATASTWRSLNGGLTNRSYRVEHENQSFVLRLDARHTHAFGLDRVREIEILKRAAGSGIAPKAIFSDAELGILLTEYVEGRIWVATDLEDQAQIESLAELLIRVHALPPCGAAMDANLTAKKYVENLLPDPGLHGFGVRCQEIIAGIEVSGVRCCCHNDLIAGNIIESSCLMLMDWEYACDNDPLFDLASLIGYHDLQPETAGILLSAYAGGRDSELEERIEGQIRLYGAIQWLWLASRQMITATADQAARLKELQQRIR